MLQCFLGILLKDRKRNCFTRQILEWLACQTKHGRPNSDGMFIWKEQGKKTVFKKGSVFGCQNQGWQKKIWRDVIQQDQDVFTWKGITLKTEPSGEKNLCGWFLPSKGSILAWRKKKKRKHPLFGRLKNFCRTRKLYGIHCWAFQFCILLIFLSFSLLTNALFDSLFYWLPLILKVWPVSRLAFDKFLVQSTMGSAI